MRYSNSTCHSALEAVTPKTLRKPSKVNSSGSKTKGIENYGSHLCFHDKLFIPFQLLRNMCLESTLLKFHKGKKYQTIFVINFLKLKKLFYCFYIYLHVYTLFGPPLPPPPGRTCSTLLFSDFVEEKIYQIKRKTAFLLV
jgi:hypothetical protein